MISQQLTPSLPSLEHRWRESLSALVDGECRSDELAAVLQADWAEVALHSVWNEYLAVGAALRGASARVVMPASPEFVAAVIGRLGGEQGAANGVTTSGFGLSQP